MIRLPADFGKHQDDPTPIGDDLHAAAKILGIEINERPTLGDSAKLIRAMAEQFAELAKVSGEFALEAANAMKSLHGR